VLAVFSGLRAAEETAIAVPAEELGYDPWEISCRAL
jgi:hypothetical protein